MSPQGRDHGHGFTRRSEIRKQQTATGPNPYRLLGSALRRGRVIQLAVKHVKCHHVDCHPYHF